MKLIAETTVKLPFTLDFCAQGPDVEPLTCRINDMDVTLYFPPSLGEDTDGQGLFGDWAWWTGRSLALVLECEIEPPVDVDRVRADALATGNIILRRFLNAYRVRFQRPEVHPVQIDSRALILETITDIGAREALTEPFSAFFYQGMPSEPPLGRSVNATTWAQFQDALSSADEQPIVTQLQLDAEALEAQGETERAALIRRLARETP